MKPPGVAARWLLAALCLAFVAWYFARNRDDLELLRRIGATDLAALTGIYVAYFAVQASRYRQVLEAGSERRVDARAWLKIFVLGRFMNFLVPQSGNLYRAAELKRAHGIGYTQFVASLAGFAWLETALNLAVASLALALLAPGMRLAGLPLAGPFAALAGLALAAPYLLQRAIRRPTPRAGALGRLRERADEVLVFATALGRRPLFLLRFLVLGLFTLSLGAALFWVAFRALEVDAGGAEIVLFLLLLRAGVVVHLTPANLGVMEVGFGLLGQELGLGLGEGLLVSGLLRLQGLVVLTALALPFGGLSLLRRRGRSAA